LRSKISGISLEQGFQFGNLQPCFGELALGTGQGQLQLLLVADQLWFLFRLVGDRGVHRIQS